MANPYTSFWDSTNEIENTVSEWMKNGTLFSPTWEEMGHRCVKTSRYVLKKAREQDSKAAARELFKNAMVYRNLAEKCFKEHRKVIVLSR